MKTIKRTDLQSLQHRAEDLITAMREAGGNFSIPKFYSDTKKVILKAHNAGVIKASFLHTKSLWFNQAARHDSQARELVVTKNNWDHASNEKAPERQRGRNGRAYSEESCRHQFENALTNVVNQCGRIEIASKMNEAAREGYRPYTNPYKRYRTNWRPALIQG